MKEVTSSNFGLLIAYLIPGFTALWGLSYFSPTLQTWLAGADESAPTIGGFLYATIASLAAGLTVSTIRWMVVDTLHHLTGIPRPDWDFGKLQSHIAAYDTLEGNHYKYYQFYGNSLIALTFLYIARRRAIGFFSAGFGWIDLSAILLFILLYAGSRDTLKKYYIRVNMLLGQAEAETARTDPPPQSGKAERSEPMETSDQV